MVKGLYTAYTGMMNEQHRMDVLTNNLANANTNGYKKEGTTSQAFDAQLALKIKDYSDARYTARGLGYINQGVKIGEGYTDWSEGPMKETGNTFDLAIGGNGFFAIDYTNKAINVQRDPANSQGIFYTRDGNFTLTAAGELVTQDGDFVLDPDGNHIQVDPNLPTEINRQGQIIQNGAVAGTVGIYDFEKTIRADGTISYDTLTHYAENLWQASDAAVAVEPENATINAGFLEQSNVSVVDEMVNMINVQRQYELNQKMIQTEDDTLEPAVTRNGQV